MVFPIGLAAPTLRLALHQPHRRPGFPGKRANYWHMLPQADQARKALWDAVNPATGMRRIDEAFPRELRDVTRDNEMFIRFKSGSTYQVVGSDNYENRERQRE